LAADLEGLGHPLFELADAGFVAGVRGSELGAGAAGGFGHTLPEAWGLGGIETGAGDVDEAHIVGFGFVVAGEGEHETVLGADAEGAEDGAALAVVHIGDGDAGGESADLEELLAGDAFGAMTGDGVGDFVAHDDGEAIGVFGDGEDAGVDGGLAAGEAEGVDLRGVDEVVLPFESGVLGDGGEAAADLFDLLGRRAGRDDAFAAEDLAVGLEAEKGLFVEAHVDDLFAAGEFDGLLVGEVVVDAVEGEQDERDEAEGAAAHGATFGGIGRACRRHHRRWSRRGPSRAWG
jgi:hypothetical protein